MHAPNPDPPSRAADLDLQMSLDADRDVILRDLVCLRQVRIEIVLTVENAVAIDLTAQRQRRAKHQLYRPAVWHRQAPRQPQAHRTALRVRLRPKLRAARAKHLA